MTDPPNRAANSQPETDAQTGSEPFHLDPSRLTGRPIYETSRMSSRKHRRFSPWLVIPGLLIVLIGALYLLLFAPKPRRAVATAGLVVYAAAANNSSGTSHLWLAQADGTGAHLLTSGTSSDSSPVWSSDGYQIAFVSDRSEGQNQIYLVDGDGKNLTQVTHTSGAKSLPSFAPGSNSFIGYLSGGTLMVGDIARGDQSRLLPTVSRVSQASSSDPSIQPETATVVTEFAWGHAANSDNPGLAAILETSGVQSLAVLPNLSAPPLLTQNGQPNGPPLAAADALSLSWAPSGIEMAVALLHVDGLPPGHMASGLILFDAQGQAKHAIFPLIQGTSIGPQNPVYSPDGSLILFEMWQQPDLASRKRLGLFIVPSSGVSQLRLLAKGDAGSAQFSPDGSFIYFLGRRPHGGHDLWRIHPDGTDPMRISDGKSDVTGFALSPQMPMRNM